MQWTPLPAAYVESVTVALEQEAVRVVSKGEIQYSLLVAMAIALALGTAFLWPLVAWCGRVLRDVPCAAWLLYQEWRARRKEDVAERARRAGL